MAYNRPVTLSIAGLDPSGGAGLLADIKTFEQHRCLGLGVATAWTVQTGSMFNSVHWLTPGEVHAQLQPLLEEYDVRAVKIGIIPNLELLQSLLELLPAIPVVWDPVLAASAGGRFLGDVSDELLHTLLQRITLVTPNLPESEVLQLPRAGCKTYLKGGHAVADRGTDVLFDGTLRMQVFPSTGTLPAKHGSGCILSAAIAANLATGANLTTACTNAKAYTERILASNDQHLAYHYV